MQYIRIFIHQLYRIISIPQKLYFYQNMISGRGSCDFPFLCVVKKIAAKYDFVLCQPLYLS